MEHLASLRNIPGLDVVRPGDANETSICWRTVIEHTSWPAGIVLSRQNMPVLDRGNAAGYTATEGAARGGYILAEAAGGKSQGRNCPASTASPGLCGKGRRTREDCIRPGHRLDGSAPRSGIP